MKRGRSTCPINFGLEIFGDPWTLLIVRDMVFNDKRTYGDFLKSAEGIATNVLAERLQRLETAGLIEKTTRADGKPAYRLTDRGLELVPVLIELIIWGAGNGKADRGLSDWAAHIEADKSAAIAAAVERARRKL